MLSNKTFSRIVVTFVAILILACMGIFFLLSNSYQNALEAKVYYMVGDYNQSETLSKLALEQDRYNKLALTILKQTKISLGFLKYIENAKNYTYEIETIANRGSSKSNRLKIKMICEIMIGKFEELKSNKFSDETLKEEAKSYYVKFLNLYTDIVNEM